MPHIDPMLDLATVYVRIWQMNHYRETGRSIDFLLDRLVTCDLPRIYEHLDEDSKRKVKAITDEFGN